jgi:hypothetical protein
MEIVEECREGSGDACEDAGEDGPARRLNGQGSRAGGLPPDGIRRPAPEMPPAIRYDSGRSHMEESWT